MFHVVLAEPEIPQNTGNIARTCAATGCPLHLVHPLGFELSDKMVKRAGLDYWKFVEVHEHNGIGEVLEEAGSRFFLFTTKAKKVYTEAEYKEGDYLIFGKESAGLPEELLVKYGEHCVRIPMLEGRRSLNLSNAAAIAVYEAFRQTGFSSLEREGALHRLSWKA